MDIIVGDIEDIFDHDPIITNPIHVEKFVSGLTLADSSRQPRFHPRLRSGTSEMSSGKNQSAGRSHLCDLVFEGEPRIRPSRPARDFDLCGQCHFPWNIHPERYDSDEKEMIRFCSEYPVEPIKSIEACIAP